MDLKQNSPILQNQEVQQEQQNEQNLSENEFQFQGKVNKKLQIQSDSSDNDQSDDDRQKQKPIKDFYDLKDLGGSKTEAVCNIGDCKTTYILTGTTNSNCWYHLWVDHQKIFRDNYPKKAKKYEKRYSKPKKESSKPQTFTQFLAKKKEQTSNKNEIKTEHPQICQKLVDFKILMVIVKDNQPMSIVENEGFSSLISLFDQFGFQKKSRTTYTSRVLDVYEFAFLDVRNFLSQEYINFESFSLSIDHWKSKITNESFISISLSICHDFTLKNYFLAAFDVEDHTSTSINSDIENTLEKFGILKEGEQKNKSFLQRIFLVGDGFRANAKSVKISQFLDVYINCFSHLLNLCLFEGIKGSLVESILEVCYEITKNLSSYGDSWKEFCSFIESKDPQFIALKIQLPIPTRFNSNRQLLKAFLHNKKYIIEYLHNDQQFPLEKELSKEQWLVLEYFSQMLSVFENAFQAVEYKAQVTISKIQTLYYVLPLQIQQVVQNIPEQQVSVKKKMDIVAEQIIKTFKKKFDEVYQNQKTDIGIANILDPRYKNLIQQQDSDLFKKLQQKCVGIMKKIQKCNQTNEPQKSRIIIEQQEQQQSQQNLQQQDQVLTSSNNQQQKSPFYNLNNAVLHLLSNKDVNSIEQDMKSEFEQYIKSNNQIDQDTCPLSFWKQNQQLYPILTKVALIYLPVPATSVENERTFSTMGETLSKKRNSLNNNILEALTFLKINLKAKLINEDDLYSKYQTIKSRKTVVIKKNK